jgi:hypothetical protein
MVINLIASINKPQMSMKHVGFCSLIAIACFNSSTSPGKTADVAIHFAISTVLHFGGACTLG